MAFCASCGSQMDGQVCPKCGAAGSGGAAESSSGLTENVASALCYLFWWLTGVIFLVLAPYNKNPRIKFHAFQAILASVALAALFIGLSIITIFMPVGIIVLIGLLQMLLWLVCLALWLFLMYKAYQGSRLVLPVIGPMAEQCANK